MAARGPGGSPPGDPGYQPDSGGPGCARSVPAPTGALRRGPGGEHALGRTAASTGGPSDGAPPPTAERGPAKRKKRDEKVAEKKKPAAKRGAKPKITVADEVDLREFVGAYERTRTPDISLR